MVTGRKCFSFFLAQNRGNGTWYIIFRRKRSNDWEVYRTAEFLNHLCTFKQLTKSEDGIIFSQLSNKILLHIPAETYIYKENTKVDNQQEDTSGSVLKIGNFWNPFQVSLFYLDSEKSSVSVRIHTQKKGLALCHNGYYVGNNQRAFVICFYNAKLLANCGSPSQTCSFMMAVLGPTCAHLNYSLGNCYFPHAQVPDICATKA